uniref:Phosphoprotein (Polymerase cofactor) n=1 Tax=Cytorhabdovirus lactucanecante TaxID=1985702 RepID=A0A8F8MZF3_9RHAB|nr:phosphoprotein (polymerase cofactor) [Cytorhabdovirus lactucanecante]
MDSESLDFSSADTVILRSPNAGTNPDGHPDTVECPDFDTDIPKTSDDSSKMDNKGSSSSSKAVKDLLELAAKSQGIVVTDVMQNTAIALHHNLGLDASSLDWFVAGITFANNSMIMEKMVSAIKELQIEVRNIQVASSGIKGTSEELVSKMKANKNDIVKELDKTRDSVLSAMGGILSAPEIEQQPVKTVTIGASQGRRKSTVVPPIEINPELESPVLSKTVSTATPEERIRHEKEKLLADLDWEIEEIAQYTPLIVDFLVPDDILAMAADGLTPELKEKIQNEVIENHIALMALEEYTS